MISKNILSHYLSKYDSCIKIYTDASKQSSGVGCAFYAPSVKVQMQFKLNNATSIFSAEAIGIIKALQFIERHGYKKSIIISDSLSVLTSISQPFDINVTYENQIIPKIKLKIEKLRPKDFDISFLWIKAHIGLQHNEHVDNLAKEAVKNGLPIKNTINVDECLNQCKIKLKDGKIYGMSIALKNLQDIHSYTQKFPTNTGTGTINYRVVV